MTSRRTVRPRTRGVDAGAGPSTWAAAAIAALETDPAPAAAAEAAALLAASAEAAEVAEESVDSNASSETENELARYVDKYYAEMMAARERYSEATKQIGQMEADLAHFQNALLEAQRELEEKRKESEALQLQRSAADERVAGKWCRLYRAFSRLGLVAI